MVNSEFISEHDTFDCQTRIFSVCTTSESTLASEPPKWKAHQMYVESHVICGDGVAVMSGSLS